MTVVGAGRKLFPVVSGQCRSVRLLHFAAAPVEGHGDLDLLPPSMCDRGQPRRVGYLHLLVEERRSKHDDAEAFSTVRVGFAEPFPTIGALMAHTASCGNATTRECRCGGCAGSRHGWIGALSLAQPTMVGVRADEHRASERAWKDANKSQSKRGPTLKRSRAAVDAAKADITDWLAASLVDSPSSVTELVESLGGIVSTDVFDALCNALGAENSNKVRAEYAQKHFFCALLAELACSMQVFKDNLDQAIKKVAASLISYNIAKKNVRISEVVTDAASEAAVEGIHRLIDNMPAVRNFNDLHRAVRILATMTCPAPEKHEAVIRCCLAPLGAPIVSGIVTDRLKMAMPDWMN